MHAAAGQTWNRREGQPLHPRPGALRAADAGMEQFCLAVAGKLVGPLGLLSVTPTRDVAWAGGDQAAGEWSCGAGGGARRCSWDWATRMAARPVG